MGFLPKCYLLGGRMLEFIKNNFGYIIGILLTPITWEIFETFKRTFKSKNHKKSTPKDRGNTTYR